MKTLKFSTTIKASKETVWNVLFTDENYPKWAKIFCEGSTAKTDWKQGSAVEFLTPSGDGMFSTIAQKVLYKTMVFKHLGTLRHGKRVLNDDSSIDWENAKESYELLEVDSKTELIVEMETPEEFQDFFKETFPKALKKIKELSE